MSTDSFGLPNSVLSEVNKTLAFSWDITAGSTAYEDAMKVLVPTMGSIGESESHNLSLEVRNMVNDVMSKHTKVVGSNPPKGGQSFGGGDYTGAKTDFTCGTGGGKRVIRSTNVW